uniref:Uncharacterized protein n=1 Tax=Arundo donax TaxID=35708 RepID=A0A0A8YXM2_ARUDO
MLCMQMANSRKQPQLNTLLQCRLHAPSYGVKINYVLVCCQTL